MKSLILGNSFTEPRTQFPTLVKWTCEGPYSHLLVNGPDSPECRTMRARIPRCEMLAQAGYNFPSRLAW